MVAGYFRHVVDFDPGPLEYNLNTNGYFDFFVLKLGENTAEVEDVNMTCNIKVYPNPTKGKEINISFGNTINRGTIQIIDALGNVIEQRVDFNSNLITLFKPHLHGVFFVRIVLDNGKVFIEKILIL